MQTLEPSAARELALEETLSETRIDLVILQGNVADAAKTDSRWEGMYERVGSWIKRIDTALTAALSKLQPAQPVKVTALEWQKPYPYDCTEFAETILGPWTVWDFDGENSHVRGPNDHAGKLIGGSIDAAKAAAQADYSARILSALEPSAERELALEGERHIELLAEALGKCLVAAGIVRPDAALTGPELLMFAEDLERSLSSPDHTQCCNGLSPQECADVPSRHCDGMRSGRDHNADAGKLDAVTICKKLAPYLGATEANDWRGLKDDDAISLTVKLRVGDLRTLKAVATDEADAGKLVEGDGAKWPMREVVAKAIAYHAVGDPHARTIRGDQRWEWFTDEADKFISVFGCSLPSAPSQEVAGS